MLRYSLFFPLLFAAITTVSAQNVQDVSLPLRVTVLEQPARVLLEWPNPQPAGLFLYRRIKGPVSSPWIPVFAESNSLAASWLDEGVETGRSYEYVMRRTTTYQAYGLAQVAVFTPAREQRGTVLLWIDSSLLVPALNYSLGELRRNLRNEGWTITERHSGPASTVASVKAQIKADYQADPGQVNTVFLLGHLPVPYSGNYAWDGHDEHVGAWPADAWYGDMDGVWTDSIVENTAATRAENQNIPGDGKFDPYFLPSPVELAVGRVDFSHLDPATFGADDRTALYQRYFSKNAAWRGGFTPASTKALVDDNFGYFSGEAFAADGYRNGYAMLGENQVVAGDYFGDSYPQHYLLACGVGPGNYQGAGGVGSSANFGTDTVNAVFNLLFGSYFGDWDYDSNPFLPSALAARGTTLACGWAGRPHWFLHALASGETIGYCLRETQNSKGGPAYPTSTGQGGTHVALMGDPTLLAYYSPPPPAFGVSFPECSPQEFSWDTPGDSTLLGFNLYYATSANGPFTRLNDTLLTTGTYRSTETADSQFYQLRGIRLIRTPGGGAFYQASAPAPLSLYVPGGPQSVQISAAGGTLTCANPSVKLSGSCNIPGSDFIWSGPNGFTYVGPDPVVSEPGTYQLYVVTPRFCDATIEVEVLSDMQLPDWSIPPIGINCAISSVLVIVPPGIRVQYGGKTYNPGEAIPIEIPGPTTYTVQSIANGCTAAHTLFISIDYTIPDLFVPDTHIPACSTSVSLNAQSATPNVTFQWTGLNTGFVSTLANPVVTQPDTYVVTVTGTNGCTRVQAVVVTKAPLLQVDAVVTQPSVPLAADGSIGTQAGGGQAPYSYLWNTGDTTAAVHDLIQGEYSVTITDADACTVVGLFQLQAGTGVDELPGLRYFSLSPNPTAGRLRVNLELAEAAAKIAIGVYDVTGHSVWQREFPERKAVQQEIDLSAFPPGVYLMRISAGKQGMLRRIVRTN